jgi:prepilin-type processing-associated H-X9-DG protein
MGLALMQYSEDNDNRLPIASKWMVSLHSYDKLDYNCPDVPQGATRTYGYAYNSRLSSTKLGDIPNPAATTAVYDSTKLGKNANDPLASIPSPGRHSGGNNYAFADGHIQWLTSDPSK